MTANSPRLRSALDCAERGWPVIALYTPTHTGEEPACSCSKGAACDHVGKHPRFDAQTLPHAARSATTDRAIIAGWWNRWPDANVGVASGPCSGLLVLDIDPRNGGDGTLDDLESELGKLPDTVEALTGGGGRHLLFRWPGSKSAGKLGPGVDVLGDGQLFVVEPSLHASGRRYAWELSSDPADIQIAELPDRWLERLRVGPDVERPDREQGYREGRERRVNRDSHPTEVVPALPVTPIDDWDADRVIRETVATGSGQHDRCNMDLARGVRLNLGIASLDDARPLFDRWFEQSRPHLCNPDPDEGWFKFARAFKAARIPLGASNLALAAFEAAKRHPLPDAASKVTTERMKLLVGLCAQLHRQLGSPFALSCHQIAALFGVKPSQAWEWLGGLVDIGILNRVSRGKPGLGGRNAARFEYLGD